MLKPLIYRVFIAKMKDNKNLYHICYRFLKKPLPSTVKTCKTRSINILNNFMGRKKLSDPCEVRFSMRLTPSLYRSLESRASQAGINRSTIVKNALRQYLDQ